MTLKTTVYNTIRTVKTNSPTILTALGVSGVITTAYLVGKASFKAAELITTHEVENGVIDYGDRKRELKEKGLLVWKLYIPAGISMAATISCVVGAQRAGSKRTAAAQAAFSISERAFSEYRDKVVEHIGEGKEQKIRDELAQDRVNRTPPPSQDILVSGPGNVLCMEAYTGRYFTSDMESLRKAQNDLNAHLVAHSYAYLDDFYYLIGLQPTSESSKIGWESDKLLDLSYSTTMTPDQRPCIVFEYNYVKPL